MTSDRQIHGFAEVEFQFPSDRSKPNKKLLASSHFAQKGVMSTKKCLNFVGNFCTPPRPKRQRYFGHSPNQPLSPKVDLKLPRSEISKLSLEDLDSEEDRLLQLIVCLGVNVVLQLYSVLQSIPKNFTNRLKYFVRISTFISGVQDISEERLHKIGVVLDTVNIPVCNVEDILWKASTALKTPLVTFLSPNVDECIDEGCDGKLYGAEKEVTSITLYTMAGPVPGIKCILYCKQCGARYGIDKYRPRGEGAMFYPDNLRPTVVSASNKVFFTEDLFEFMCESGNHGFVSCQAFSQIYIAVYHAGHAATKKFCDWKEASFDLSKLQRMTLMVALMTMGRVAKSV